MRWVGKGMVWDDEGGCGGGEVGWDGEGRGGRVVLW